MGKPTKGDVVLVNFPFSDLKGQKLRPALVVARAEFNDLILCQITSKPYTSKAAIKLTLKNFDSGKLPVISYVRPDKLFTADQDIVIRIVGKLNTKTTNKITNKLVSIINNTNR